MLNSIHCTRNFEMSQKDFAHRVFTPEEIEKLFKPRKGRLPRKNITSGDLILRVVKLKKDEKLDEHAHSKRMDKFLLSGHLKYEDDQDFPVGSWAKLSARRPYSVTAVEDSQLLLVERLGTQNIPVNQTTRDRVNEVLSGFYRRRRNASLFFSRTWLPFLILLILLVPGTILLCFGYPTTEDAKLDLYREIGVSLLSALLFFVILEWARRVYLTKTPKVFGAFDLDDFCDRIKDCQRTVKVYSIYSNLFLKEHLFDLFTKNVLHRFNEDRPIRIQILILSPFSQAVAQRQTERHDDIPQKVSRNILNLCNWLNNDSDSLVLSKFVKVRIADSLPRHQHHQIDEEVNFSFYPRGFPASEFRYIRSDESTPLGRFAVESFEDVWADEATTELEAFVEHHKEELIKKANG